MPSVSLNIKHQISTVIKRFKFEELEDTVIPIFPEVTWDEIKSILVKSHESLTTLNTLKIIDEKIKQERTSEHELKDRLGVLEVLDVSRHYKRKVWYCHELKGKSSINDLSLDELATKIKNNFAIHHMQVDVRIVMHNDIIFVSVKDRPKKKQMKTILPSYFSFIRDENFFFCSKKNVIKTALVAMTDSMGYQSCKQIKLMGKDIPSLIKMLLTRKNALTKGGLVKPSLKFRHAFPTLTPLGLDFTQHKQRIKYAEKCFGEEPPTFEYLRVNCSDQLWKNKDDYKELPDSTIYTGIEFQSSSIPNFLKNLVVQQILRTPLPCYAANVLSLARNEMTLKGN